MILYSFDIICILMKKYWNGFSMNTTNRRAEPRQERKPTTMKFQHLLSFSSSSLPLSKLDSIEISVLPVTVISSIDQHNFQCMTSHLYHIFSMEIHVHIVQNNPESLNSTYYIIFHFMGKVKIH